MAVRWYYKVMGQEAGPVSASELKELAASGFLTPDVLLRKGEEGAWFPSGDVQGLYDDGSGAAADESPKRPAAPASPAPKQARADGPAGPEDEAASEPSASPPQAAGTGWYCQVMGKEIGPLSPSALRELAASGFLSPGVSVRKGIDGDWVSSDRVKGLFAEAPAKAPPSGPQSSGVAWYYEVMGEETGPLSTAQLRELAESGFITSDVLVRKGADGRWLPAGEVEGLFTKADKTAAATLSPDAAEALPPIPKPPPAPIAGPPPAANLRDAVDKASDKPAPARAQAADAGWYYEAMGKKTGPLSSSALKELADSGLLTPDTRVRKGSAGNWVAAKQVKGLFERRAAAAVSKKAKRPAAKPAPRPAAESVPEPLPESALEPLPAPIAASPMGDFLSEALAEPMPSESASSDIYATVPVTLPPRRPALGSGGAALGDSPKPKRRRKRRKKSAAESGGILGGVGLMLAAVVWFMGGLAVGYIFFYPPILFLIGLGIFFKGIFSAISGEE